MAERTEEENHIIELKVVQALTAEMINLYKIGHTKGYVALLEYLAVADGASLVRLHDILEEFKTY